VEQQKAITRAETTGSFLLWFGVLAGPLAWAGQLLLVFGLPEGVVCTPGNRTAGQFFNTDVRTVIQITNGVATALTLLALFVSYRCYRRLRESDATTAQRARWLAMAGMFNSTLFVMLTAVKFASPLFLTPCAHSL
jgi:hypothetical protein